MEKAIKLLSLNVERRGFEGEWVRWGGVSCGDVYLLKFGKYLAYFVFEEIVQN